MNDMRDAECAKCGSETRTEEWTASDHSGGAALVRARCDNPYCEDYQAPAPRA